MRGGNRVLVFVALAVAGAGAWWWARDLGSGPQVLPEEGPPEEASPARPPVAADRARANEPSPEGPTAPHEAVYAAGEALPRGGFAATAPRLRLPSSGGEEVRGAELAEALLATGAVWIRWADPDLRRRAREAVAPVPRAVLADEALPAEQVLTMALEALGACADVHALRPPVLYVGVAPPEEGSSPR